MSARCPTCERCGQRPATVCAWEGPENDAGPMFGDELLGLLLCGACLLATEGEGPWDGVEVLEEVA